MIDNDKCTFALFNAINHQDKILYIDNIINEKIKTVKTQFACKYSFQQVNNIMFLLKINNSNTTIQ